MINNNNYTSWQDISKRLNNYKETRSKSRKFWASHLKNVQMLKAQDIDDNYAHIIPSSVLYNASRFNDIINQVLLGWMQNNELNEIFYRIAGEGTPQSIANTFTALAKASSKIYLKKFVDALEQSGRTADFIQNADKLELDHTLRALTEDRFPNQQERNIMNAVNQRLGILKHSSATKIQSFARGRLDQGYVSLVKNYKRDLLSAGSLFSIPQRGKERKAFEHALELNRGKSQTFR